MGKIDFESWSIIRKLVFLVLFIVGIILIFNTSASMLNVGVDSITGVSIATDKRTAYSLISLFGFVGYFVEVIFEKYMDIKKEDIK